MTGIYAIESPTGAIYIGQSRDIEKRFKQYKNFHCKDQPRIYNSLVKHTPEKHKFSVIHHMNDDRPQEYLDGYEVSYIKLFRDNGFDLMNLKEGGINGRIFFEGRQKISRAKKGKPGKIGADNPFFGKKHTDETKKILSEHRKIIKLTEDHKQKLKASRKGKPAWNSGKTLDLTQEQRQKHIDAWKGKKHTEETKRLMSQSAMGKNVGANNGGAVAVYMYDMGLNFIKEFPTIVDAAKEVNVSHQSIASALKSKTNHSSGFIWKYKTAL